MSAKKQQVELFKEIMGSYPTGVTIITTKDNNNNPIGLTVNSFASVSIDPLMVLWCIDKQAGSIETFKNSNSFAVNILADDQKEACWAFANREEKDRFSKVEWETSSNNLPIINGAFSVLECKKVDQINAGDHLILIGEVMDLKKDKKDPMLYYRRSVGSIPDSWGG